VLLVPDSPSAATEGVKDALPGFSEQMGTRMRSLAQGADTITWLALADAQLLTPGGFYLDREPQVVPSPGCKQHYSSLRIKP